MKIIAVTFLCTFAVSGGTREYKSTPSLEGKVRMIVHPLQSLSHDLNPEIIVALAYITDDYREHIANGVAINSRHILISADSVEDHLDIPNLNGIGAIIMNIFYYAINLRVPTKKSKEPDSKYNDIGLMTTLREIKHYLPIDSVAIEPWDAAYTGDVVTLVGWNQNLTSNGVCVASYEDLQLIVEGRGKACTNDTWGPQTEKIICASPPEEKPMPIIGFVNRGSPLFQNHKLLGILTTRHCPKSHRNIIFTCLIANADYIEETKEKSINFLKLNKLYNETSTPISKVKEEEK